MNDRFKFRCFDKENKKFLHHLSFDISPNGILILFGGIEGKKYLDVNDTDRYVLIQCTGLKDKNGKLIYEGDIVRFIYGNKKRLGYVEENKTVWSITNSNFCQGAWCSGALINLYETCEVIGNIYENKDLLLV